MRENRQLTKAKSAKNDEFYTQYNDIQKEVSAYVDSPGVARPRRSTRTRLTVSAWGGTNGGTLTLASQNLGKLAPVACGPMVLPPLVTLAPYQEWSVSFLCEGAA